jgi:iron complex transport system ATP-binding protein
VTAVLELSKASAHLGDIAVLTEVDLAVAAGEMVAVVGPNGAGKSSAIRALAGLLPLTAGVARLAGRNITELSPRERAARTAYLPQERRIAWNLPAREIAALGAPFLSGAEAARVAHAALAEVEADHLADRGVADMSGGERARVLLARAFAAGADALLADEPIAGLDPDAQLMVLERLRARARNGQAVLVSLHDLALAARFADRVVVLAQGRVIADAPPLAALTPRILGQVFGLSGRWIDGPDGPLLASGRYSDGSGSGVRVASSEPTPE